MIDERAAGTPVDPVVIDDFHLGQPQIIATYLFRGAAPFLVDPGPTSTLGNLEAGLAAAGLSLADVQAILLTHIHLDHAGATGTILARYPHIQVYVHAEGAAHIIDPQRLMTSAGRLYGDMMDTLWGEMLPVPAESLTTLRGGETLQLGERSLQVYDAPGHAPHHLIYFDMLSRAACIGDNGGCRLPGFEYISPTTPPPTINLEAWDKTLDLIRDLEPRMLLLTHFGRHDDVAAHLERYRRQLRHWAAVVQAGLERGADQDSIETDLLALERAALPDAVARQQYQQASPVGLNAAGLARYWRKHNTNAS